MSEEPKLVPMTFNESLTLARSVIAALAKSDQPPADVEQMDGVLKGLTAPEAVCGATGTASVGGAGIGNIVINPLAICDTQIEYRGDLTAVGLVRGVFAGAGSFHKTPSQLVAAGTVATPWASEGTGGGTLGITFWKGLDWLGSMAFAGAAVGLAVGGGTGKFSLK